MAINLALAKNVNPFPSLKVTRTSPIVKPEYISVLFLYKDIMNEHKYIYSLYTKMKSYRKSVEICIRSVYIDRNSHELFMKNFFTRAQMRGLCGVIYWIRIFPLTKESCQFCNKKNIFTHGSCMCSKILISSAMFDLLICYKLGKFLVLLDKTIICSKHC